ncbi:SPOR domain-containing protein [Phenylobacterium kunshanense]|uniref:SPOR domain-containing protein n=1 Tax=Phenylobacterium kunshanense TaxID=1445034 RepID=A0A328B984_9CAUL|nr:SPOR domain-containing protein [Phenylobacterium kunshanense]RAK62476.1 hypothetical protein DJ019_18820 [Phenylobacterium kunshanense]
MSLGRAVLAGAVWLAGGLAAAQEAPTFPASLEREPLLAWLQRETDIMPERVIAVTPQAVTSVVSTFPASGAQGPRLVIRAEALNAESHARAGALSWHVSISADCQGRRVRLGDTTGYPQRNLLGERMLLRSGDADWRTPDAGTALDFAWRAACDPKFQGPFQSARMRVAQADGPMVTAPPQAPAPVAEVSPAIATPPPAAPRPDPAPVARGGMVAQVGAGASEAEARGLLVALESVTGGRPTWVERAVVGGRTWHRAVVGGFSNAAEAGQFCAGLKAAGRDCFVRPGRGG